MAALIGVLVILFFALRNQILNTETDSPSYDFSKEILADKHYKDIFNDPRSESTRGNKPRSEEDSLYLLLDQKLYELFQGDSITVIIDYLQENPDSYNLRPVDSFKLAVSYFHEGNYDKSLKLLNTINEPQGYADATLWYKICNYLMKDDLKSAEPLLCRMEKDYFYQKEKVKWMIKHFSITC